MVQLSLQLHIICALAIPMLPIIANCKSGFGFSCNDMKILQIFVKIDKMIKKLKPWNTPRLHMNVQPDVPLTVIFKPTFVTKSRNSRLLKSSKCSCLSTIHLWSNLQTFYHNWHTYYIFSITPQRNIIQLALFVINKTHLYVAGHNLQLGVAHVHQIKRLVRKITKMFVKEHQRRR